MEFGFNIPTRGPLATPEAISILARRGEELGFAYISVPDHIVVPHDIASRYPYTRSGEFPGGTNTAVGGECLEQITLMGFLASATERARIMTSIMVVPHRNPIHAAKALATVDVLSGGRVTLGCGVGWMAEEFAAIGTPPFAERGKVTDEYLAAFKTLWTEEQPAFDGTYTRFSGIAFEPKPAQPGGIPIWIGGESPAALRRVVASGDSWFPIGANPRHPLNTVDRFRGGIEKLRHVAEAADRDPASIGLAFWANWYIEDQAQAIDTGERHIFTGSDPDILEDAFGMAELGVQQLLFNFQRATLEETLASMDRFANEIMAKMQE